jgi:ubiquinone/menaquinone biosynthesis C-methylase UbiE
MPQEEEWDKFFDPINILKLLGVDKTVRGVVDFGCGYGTFTIPAAKLIQGNVYAIDIEPEMLKVVKNKAKELNLHNVRIVLRDFVSDGSGLEDCSIDYVMLFNILHGKNPMILLKEAYRILKSNGRLGIVHWNYSSSTPRGPPMELRSKPEQCRSWAESVGFVFVKSVDLKPYHFGLLFRK